MRKQMIENAAYEVATQVRAVEDSIEAALTEIAELQARMSCARVVDSAPASSHSHAAFEQLAAPLSGLVAARGAIVGCHAALAEAQGQGPGPAHRRASATATNARRRRRSADLRDRRLNRRIDRRRAHAGPVAPSMLPPISSGSCWSWSCGYALLRARRTTSASRRSSACWRRRRDQLVLRRCADAATRASRPACCSSTSRCFAGFLCVALRSERFWPLWVAGLQLTTSFGPCAEGDRRSAWCRGPMRPRASSGAIRSCSSSRRHLAQHSGERASPPDRRTASA